MQMVLGLLQLFVVATAWSYSKVAIEHLEKGNFALLVTKQTNELKIKALDDDQKKLHSFRAISGSNMGDKEVEGDEKTPEGIYFVTRKIPRSMMTDLHGALAFGLNYPNLFDRFEKKTGFGIWIHGVDKPERMEKRFDTRGCVALSNEDVTKLGEYLRHEIPVVIVDTEEEAQQVRWNHQEGPLVDEVRQWAKAWSSREIEPYMEFYHKDFKGKKGMNYAQWKDWKSQLTRAYSRIDVEVDDVLVIEHPKYRYAVFQQKYESNRYKAAGKKRLFWKRSDDGKWRIVLEEGFRQQVGFIN